MKNWALIAGLLYSLLPVIAQAAEEEHSSGGLPQFDPTYFPSQIFWLTITFVVLYVFFSAKVLPEISGVLEDRAGKIRADMDAAEKLKNEAEAAHEGYEDLLGGARAESTKLMTEAGEKARANAEKASGAFREKTETEILSLDKRLQVAKAKAMDEMSGVAAEIAAEAAAKIVGIKADLGKAKTVVQALNKKEAA